MQVRNALHLTVVSNAANDITPSFTRMIPVITQDTLQRAQQDDLMVSVPNPTNTKESENTAGGSGITSVSYVTAPESITSNSVLMMTAEVILSGPNGHQMVARALLDPASTASFVTERLVQHLKLCKQRQEITINELEKPNAPPRVMLLLTLT